MHRDADYEIHGFKDTVKVKFNDFKVNIKDWVLKYFVNSYLNVQETLPYEPLQMKYESSFLGGCKYSEKANKHIFTFFNLTSIKSMLADTGTIKIKGHEKANVLTEVNIDIKASIIDYNINLKFLNVSEDGKHLNSWTEDGQTSFDELK